MAMQGFRRGFQCAELVHCLRAVGKATEWSVPAYMSQVDFAQARDSVRAMRRGVPPLVVAADLRDMRHSELLIARAGWQTRPIAPTVGLRQGCSLSRLVFRWVLEDAVSLA